MNLCRIYYEKATEKYSSTLNKCSIDKCKLKGIFSKRNKKKNQ